MSAKTVTCADDQVVNWHSCSDVAPPERPKLWNWLVESGSLTTRVRARCETDFKLRIIRQVEEKVTAEIAPLLDVDAGAKALLREVTLNCGATPLIFARSIMPDTSVAGKNSWLTELGTRPLGDALFDVRDMRRSEFEIALIHPKSELFTRIHKVTGVRYNEIWARRSVVHINQEPILICECFLTDLLN